MAMDLWFISWLRFRALLRMENILIDWDKSKSRKHSQRISWGTKYRKRIPQLNFCLFLDWINFKVTAVLIHHYRSDTLILSNIHHLNSSARLVTVAVKRAVSWKLPTAVDWTIRLCWTTLWLCSEWSGHAKILAKRVVLMNDDAALFVSIAKLSAWPTTW